MSTFRDPEGERPHPDWPAREGVEVGCDDRTCSTCYVQGTVYHVTIPAIALVRADTPEEAERIVARGLERAGFTAYEEGRVVFESEEVPEEHLWQNKGRIA